MYEAPTLGTRETYGRTPSDTAAQPRPVGHVIEQAGETGRLIDTLGQEVQALEQRLAAILRPVPPTGSGAGEKAVRPVMSPHAEGLTEVNGRLFAIVQHVRELVARADL